MSRHTENLNGGVVTIRDASVLNPGELTFVRNAVLVPGTNALWRATGRTAFGTATASAIAVDGLRDARFDNGGHYVIAHTSASYVTAAVGDTGTFGVLASGVGDGSQLEVAHYRNRFILFNGVSAASSGQPSNKVMYLSATGAVVPTLRQNGMLPVEAAPFVSSTAGTFSQTVTGYYEYWTTEAAKFQQDGAQVTLESAFSGNPTTLFVSATAMVPVINIPLLANPGFTTHWRIYRSPKKDKQSDKKFPTGFMIAEMTTATTAVSDSFTVASASSLPGSVNTGAEQLAGFANASSLTLDNNNYASATATLTGPKAQGVYGFNLGGFTGSVRGIAVELQIFADASPVGVAVRIGRNRNSTTGGFLPDTSNIYPGAREAFGEFYEGIHTAVKSAVVTATSNPGQTIVLGGETDRWQASNNPLPFNDSDFGANFMVAVSVSPYANVTRVVQIDYVKLTVYYSATVDSVVPFPTVVYTFGDISAQVAKNGPPPSSSTGDLFEDSLVVNDVSNPGLIRYSYPGSPESFPSTYYIDFETRNNDRVTNIKVVNSRLVVLLQNSAFRVNYLPSERDASFDRGKAIEPISAAFGCLNEMCAARYTPEGGPEQLAWVGDNGIHSTDGHSFETLTEDLDWSGVRSSQNSSTMPIALAGGNYTPIALVDDPENESLIFLFRNDNAGFGGTYSAMYIHYNDRGASGKPKISGWVVMRNTIGGQTAEPASMWPVRRSSGRTEVFIGYGGATAAGAGQVYRQTGTTLPIATPTMRYRTRLMYLNGMGNEWKLDSVYGLAGIAIGDTDPFSVSYQAANRKTNGGVANASVKTYTFSSQQNEPLHRITFNQMAEGIDFSATVSGQGVYAQEAVILDGEGFGVEDSGL